MIKIDSYHIEVPKIHVDHMGLSMMTETTKSTGLHTHDIKNPIAGLKSILVDHRAETVKIQGSAKILTDDYHKGISIETFDQWVDTINSTGLIEIKPQNLYDFGVFHSIDTTHNVPMGTNWDLINQWKEVQNGIMVSAANPAFTPHTWDTKTNKGVEFRGGQSTTKNRCIFYVKQIELQRSKNKDFFAACKNPNKVYNDMKDILRTESNNTSHKDIKKRFAVDSMAIGLILNSAKLPTLDMLNKITAPDQSNQLELLFNTYPAGTDIKHIAMIHGLENIIRSANYNVKSVKEFVKRYTSESMYRWWWYGGKDSTVSIRDLIQEVKHKDKLPNDRTNPIMDHIKQAIQLDYKNTA